MKIHLAKSRDCTRIELSEMDEDQLMFVMNILETTGYNFLEEDNNIFITTPHRHTKCILEILKEVK